MSISHLIPILSQFKTLLAHLRVNTHNTQETTLIHAILSTHKIQA